VSPGDLGTDLERLPGVLAATVFDDAPDGPRVYLATDPLADTDTLRATVLGLLRDRGLHAPPDHVHIAAPGPRRAAGGVLPRAALDSVDTHRTEDRTECTVRLRTATRVATGTAADTDTPAGRLRAAANATLRASESLYADLRVGLQGIREMDLFGRRVVAVLLEATAGRAHVHLPSIALVDRSPEEAAALATLRGLRSWSA
jgi:hypothetical protein